MIQNPPLREDIGRRGEEIYRRNLGAKIETPENIGRLVSIDLDTEDYAIADSILESADLLRERRPDAVVYTKRIGYNAVYTIGGTLTRIKKRPRRRRRCSNVWKNCR